MVLKIPSVSSRVLLAIAGFFGIAIGTTGIIVLDIYRRRPSPSFTFKSLWQYYIFNCWLIPRNGKKGFNSLQSTSNTKNVRKRQEMALLSLLRRFGDSKYGKIYDLKSIKSIEEFKKKHPLTKYSHYEPYMNRIIDDDEENVLYPGKPIYVGLTSGTTAKNKRFAFSKDVLNEYILIQLVTTYYADGYCDLNRPMLVLLKPKVTHTKHGVRMGPFTGIMQRKSPKFASALDLSDETTDEHTVMYVTALVGLIEKQTTFVSFGFNAMAQSFFKTLKSDWQSICNDIRNGTLSDNLEIHPSDREFVLRSFEANPERASELEDIFKQGFKGILPKLWPNVKRIWLLRSGTFKPAADKLIDEFFGGHPAWSPFHIGTEGCYGLNLVLDGKNETMTPPFNNYFFEYIPAENVEEDQPKTYLMDELELGREYEVVVTNDRAIYRYRVGDVIKVVGFKDQLPLYNLQYRIGQMLNLFWEKTSEGVFTQSLQKSLEKMPRFRVVDYTATENENYDRVIGIESTQRHYVLFIEVTNDDNSTDNKITDEEKAIFDKTLMENFELYKTLRENGSISPMTVLQAEKGAFSKVKNYILENNPQTSSYQFKQPRVSRKDDHLKILIDNVM